MAVTCPLCHRPSSHTAPCLECWRTMEPPKKAAWIFLLRTSPAHAGLVAVVGHRDPVKDAPPTLAAYVADEPPVLTRAQIATLVAALGGP